MQPLRLRLEQIAPSVRVGWMPGQGPEIIDALRHGRCHFAIDIESMALPAPDIHVLKLYDDRLATLARSGHPLDARETGCQGLRGQRPHRRECAATIELLDRELAKMRLACNISTRVSSVLAGSCSRSTAMPCSRYRTPWR